MHKELYRVELGAIPVYYASPIYLIARSVEDALNKIKARTDLDSLHIKEITKVYGTLLDLEEE